MKQSSLLARLQNTDNLPCLPAAFIHLTKLLKDPWVTAKQLASAIEADQALARKFLHIANAPFFEFPRKVNAVQEAITLLGVNTTRHFMLAVSAMRAFLAAGSVPHFDLREFWHHEIGVGIVARYLARKARYDVEIAFLAGILHDIGKPILSELFAEALVEILDLMQKKRLNFYQAEQQLGWSTHCELGGYLAEKWNLALPLIEAIRTHHCLGEAREDQKLVCIVHIANTLCKGFGVGFRGWVFEPEFDIYAFERLELRVTDVEKWLPEFLGEIERAHELFALAGQAVQY